MKNIHLIILTTLLLFTACSQKVPKIDGQKSKFHFKFYPAKNGIVGEKSPLLFLFEGYYGKWAHPSIAKKFQSLGYNTVTVGFFSNDGLSNNLSRVNINDIKKTMDTYKRYSNIDTNAIGLIGRGKGGELALVLGSLYPEFKMVVGMTAPNVVFQASNINLAHHSSWVHNGKELDFVPYPLLSLTTVKSIFNMITQITSTSFRDIHIEALKNKKAVKKARIKVENINGSIFLISSNKDTWVPSVMMAKEIVKTLKSTNFTHHYEHQEYNTTNYMKSMGKEWDDTYLFVMKNLKSKVTVNAFEKTDLNKNKNISFEEFLTYKKTEEHLQREKKFLMFFNKCDSNRNHKIDYSEARIQFTPKNNSDIINLDDVYLPSINYRCRVSQSSFNKYDLDADMSLSFNEFQDSFKRKERRLYSSRTAQNITTSANGRFKQCDTNNDEKISQKEAMMETCHIGKSIFTLADKNKNDFISLSELTALPAKYAQYRDFFYVPHERDKVVYIHLYTSKTPTNLLFHAINECDDNHDGQLNQVEATAERCGFTEEEFLEADVSKDGLFSNEDMLLKDKMKQFETLDSDSDGQLNFTEWIKVY